MIRTGRWRTRIPPTTESAPALATNDVLPLARALMVPSGATVATVVSPVRYVSAAPVTGDPRRSIAVARTTAVAPSASNKIESCPKVTPAILWLTVAGTVSVTPVLARTRRSTEPFRLDRASPSTLTETVVESVDEKVTSDRVRGTLRLSTTAAVRRMVSPNASKVIDASGTCIEVACCATATPSSFTRLPAWSCMRVVPFAALRSVIGFRPTRRAIVVSRRRTWGAESITTRPRSSISLTES